MTTPTKTTVEIFTSRIDLLDERLVKLNRKCAKLNMPAVTYEIVGTRSEVQEDATKVLSFTTIELTGSAPMVNGWTFVATIEHTEAGTIISRAPYGYDFDMPAHVRGESNICEHCNTARNRIETFVVAKDGEVKIVGRNCLADFLASDDVAAALRAYNMVIEFEGDLDELGTSGGGLGPGDFGDEIVHYTALVARRIELSGWTSKGKASEWETPEMATATRAKSNMAYPVKYSHDTDERHAADVAVWEEAQPTADSIAAAVAALAWAQALTGDSDYEQNLKVACSLHSVTRRHSGLVASAVSGHRRALDKADELRKRPTVNNEHFGTVGSRYVRELSLITLREMSNDFGDSTLMTFQDAEGHVFKWFASGTGFTYEKGVAVTLVFAVKKHDDWKGNLQTGILRVSTVDPKKAPKWVSAVGEVFKTRKAMKAAETTQAAA